MITMYILASRRDARAVRDLWVCMSILRRQAEHVVWVEPVYVEDMVESYGVVEMMPQDYMVIWCLSNSLLSALLHEPALRELHEGSRVNMPFQVSLCDWNQRPSPFVGRHPLNPTPLTSVSSSQRDSVLVDVVKGIRKVVSAF